MWPRIQNSSVVRSLNPTISCAAGSTWTMPLSISNSNRCGLTARMPSSPTSGFAKSRAFRSRAGGSADTRLSSADDFENLRQLRQEDVGAGRRVLQLLRRGRQAVAVAREERGPQAESLRGGDVAGQVR